MSIEWIPSAEETRILDYWFRCIDNNNTGVVGGVRIVNFLRSSNLNMEHLKILWDLVDTANTGTIYRKQFYKLIRLVTVCLYNPQQPPSLQLYTSTVHYSYPLPTTFSIDPNYLDGKISTPPQNIDPPPQLYPPPPSTGATIQTATTTTTPVVTGFGALPPVFTTVANQPVSTNTFGSPVPQFPAPQIQIYTHGHGHATPVIPQQQQPTTTGYPILGAPTQQLYGGYPPMQPLQPTGHVLPPGYYGTHQQQIQTQPVPILGQQPVSSIITPTQPYVVQLPNPSVTAAMQPIHVTSPITPSHSVVQPNPQPKQQQPSQLPAIVYEKGRVLIYDKNNGIAPQQVTIVAVHKDDFPNVYYTIKFANGVEKQTEFMYLKAL